MLCHLIFIVVLCSKNEYPSLEGVEPRCDSRQSPSLSLIQQESSARGEGDLYAPPPPALVVPIIGSWRRVAWGGGEGGNGECKLPDTLGSLAGVQVASKNQEQFYKDIHMCQSLEAKARKS